jgi:sugar lactone lactonase YvrE
MNTRTLIVLLLISFALASTQVLYEWVELEFDWDAIGNKQEHIDNGSFIPENCALAGIKLWKDRTFVTVPRWTPGVISTLNEVIQTDSGVAILRPFPSYEANDPSKGGFVYVQSMEVDPQGKMWILDTGSQNLFEGELIIGTPRLIVLDIESESIDFVYTFESPVVPENDVVFLNDIVLDLDRNFAYITDTWGDGGIIVFDVTARKARRFTDSTTQADLSYETQTFCGEKTITLGATPSDGIALSVDGKTLYWCALIGVNVYSLDTSLLRDFDVTNDQLSSSVKFIGAKRGLSDGMAMAPSGDLYFGNLAECGVQSWDVSLEKITSSNQPFVAKDSKTLMWVDTFAFDEFGDLYFTTNKLGYFFNDLMDFSGASGPNFRIVKLPLNPSNSNPSTQSSSSTGCVLDCSYSLVLLIFWYCYFDQ